MFDQFTVIYYAFAGKLKGSLTIRKYFWAFLAGIHMALIILAYNAFMSLNFYRQILERFTPWDSLFLPILTTMAIAITVYLLMSSLTGTILDYIAKRRFKTKGHEPMFIAVILVLIGFLCLDVYANLKGVNYVSKITTTAIQTNSSSDVFDKVGDDIKRKETLLSDLLTGKLGGYGWMQKGMYHLNNSGKRFQRALTAEIKNLRDQQKLLVSTAVDEFTNDQDRFANEVAVKRQSHIMLVWFAYPIALLICFIVQHYVDSAITFVNGSNDIPEPPDQDDLNDITYDDLPESFTYEDSTRGGATPLFGNMIDLEQREAEYLTKWKEAVDLIQAGHTNREVKALYDGAEGSISGTTIQKIKTVLRAKGLLANYAA